MIRMKKKKKATTYLRQEIFKMPFKHKTRGIVSELLRMKEKESIESALERLGRDWDIPKDVYIDKKHRILTTESHK